MTKKEMIKWLKNEVTMSGSINISLTDAEYERIMNKEINMVYQLYPVADDSVPRVCDGHRKIRGDETSDGYVRFQRP